MPLGITGSKAKKQSFTIPLYEFEGTSKWNMTTLNFFSYANPTYDFMEGRSCPATAAIAKMTASSSPSLFSLKMPFTCEFFT